MKIADIIELAKLGWKPSDVKELLSMETDPKPEDPKPEDPKPEDPKPEDPKEKPEDPFEKLAKS